MYVSVSVGFGEFGIENVHLVEMLRALGAVFEHGAHGSVAVDIGVLTLDIALFGVGICYILKCLHKTGVHIPYSCSFGSVKDIAFRRAHISVGDEHSLDLVLDLFDGRYFNAVVLEKVEHLSGKGKAGSVILRSRCCRECLIHGAGDFIDVKISGTSVTLFDCGDHFLTS